MCMNQVYSNRTIVILNSCQKTLTIKQKQNHMFQVRLYFMWKSEKSIFDESIFCRKTTLIKISIISTFLSTCDDILLNLFNVRTVPKSNRKIVERGKIDTPSTLSWLGSHFNKKCCAKILLRSQRIKIKMCIYI